MEVSFQLYSARNADDQAEFLKTLSGLGYAHVEGYGGVYGDAAGYKSAMDAAGIAMPSGHMGLAELENDFAGCVEIAQTLGFSKVFAPYLEESDRPTDAAGWRTLGERLQKIAAKAEEHGIAIGWHNHEFEFEALPTGEIPMDLILAGGSSIFWEADIAWIIRGGQDPKAYIEKYGDRITAVHVKDIAPAGEKTDEDGWADVGTGTVDWAALTQIVRDNAPSANFIMEHDNPSDIERFARVSIKNFRKF